MLLRDIFAKPYVIGLYVKTYKMHKYKSEQTHSR